MFKRRRNTKGGQHSSITTTLGGGGYGRLGNQIIRNLAVSLIAEKFNLKVDYSNNTKIELLGINLFTGNSSYNQTKILNDNNYFSIYNGTSFNYNLNANRNFFQTKQITNLLYEYLHSDKIRYHIIDKNPFKVRYNNNKDLFIHVRLTDASKFNPGIGYYKDNINRIKYDTLYISTDEKNNDLIIKLMELYPNANLINYDEVQTFQFASTCKNIILSQGSFSAIIGYLSFFSEIYYPDYHNTKKWHGDMFSIKGWNTSH